MRLSELRSAMKRYATRFDPALVSPRDAARVVEDAAAIEKMAATVKSMVEGRGKRALVRPDDPRHPRYRARPFATGPPTAA